MIVEQVTVEQAGGPSQEYRWPGTCRLRLSIPVRDDGAHLPASEGVQLVRGKDGSQGILYVPNLQRMPQLSSQAVTGPPSSQCLHASVSFL